MGINESILILRRCKGERPPTRIINLDKFPNNEEQIKEFWECWERCESGDLPREWGHISFWPRERIERGDWTAAIWRSPELANAAAEFAEDTSLPTLAELELHPEQAGKIMSGVCERCEPEMPGSFLVLDSKGADGQITIQSRPDGCWVHKQRDKNETAKLLAKAGHLMITEGQTNNTARLTAVANEKKYFGYTWLSVRGLTADQAKALAVFLNSTVGRLQIMRNMGGHLGFPIYRPAGIANIRVLDIFGAGGVLNVAGKVLLECWKETKSMKVPQYRDGDETKEDCPVNPRPIWDACVAKVMRGNPLFALPRLNHLRSLLHREPHIRGKSYHQFEDE